MVSFPSLQWIEQNPSIDPSGSRHLSDTGAGFIRELGTGAGQELNFGQMNTTNSGAISSTKLVYARVSDFGDASGVFNMRFYWYDVSGWNIGTYRFLEQKGLHFIPDLQLNSAAQNTPTIIPSTANMSGTITPGWGNGSPWVSGVADGDVTNYVWLGILAGVDVPIGQIGGAGAGTFRARLIYDFS